MVCWCYSFLSRFSLIFENRVVICCLAKFVSVLCHLFLCFLALLYPFRVDVTEFPLYRFLLLDGLLYYFSIIVEVGFWSILGWCFLHYDALIGYQLLVYICLYLCCHWIWFLYFPFSFLNYCLVCDNWVVICFIWCLYIFLLFFSYNFAQLQIVFNLFLMGFLFLV